MQSVGFKSRGTELVDCCHVGSLLELVFMMRARIHLRRWVDLYEHRHEIYAMLGIRVTEKRILTDRYTIKFIYGYFYFNWLFLYENTYLAIDNSFNFFSILKIQRIET